MARQTNQVRPARVDARLVQWGDILVTSPEKDALVIGTVVGQIEVPGDQACKWQIRRASDGLTIESNAVPLGNYVWVHLPAGKA